ncbi:MAG TPA: Gfo/Idh/MocA family oxidoreductase, partial [Tepidisphaeraceae bacterium]|nr:Gfo/Idh/MocA family oxidoreductase [Tepidisphaeraceae bacterium]
EGVEFGAVCDVYDANAGVAREWAGAGCKAVGDFRKVLEMKEVDAVLIATPDHWHSIPAVLACAAGKDVYVEKPLAHTIVEGRKILDAARKYSRVVQVGTQHRSAPHYAEAAKIVQGGEMGAVHFVRIWNYLNMSPEGIGKAEDSEVPEGVDWDMYLGPSKKASFNKNRFVGTYRWFWDYGGGLVTDFGTHRFDSLHQVMGVDGPVKVSASGGRYFLRDGAETPDVVQVTYEYANFILSYEASMLNGGGTGIRTEGKKYYQARGKTDRPHGEAFYGTNGTLMSDRLGFEVLPELKLGKRDRTLSRPAEVEGIRMRGREVSGDDATGLHVKNFIECVRARKKPNADVEIGHRASIVGHLGNIAYKTGRKIQWDGVKEEIVGDGEASKLLSREMRKPWDLI